METKKSPRADLEGKRTFFLEIGLVVSVVIMLVAFEWKTYEVVKIDIPDRYVPVDDEDIINITKQEEPLKPPPVPPVLTTILNIVDDKTLVSDELLVTIEDDQFVPAQPWTPPAPEPDVVDVIDEPFIVVEVEPEFPGGELARKQFLNENITYPKLAREIGVAGTVYVTFIIEKDGSVTDVRILRGIGGGCDEEAVRVVKAMPNWIPGKQRGKTVRVQFNMPIKFTLAGS